MKKTIVNGGIWLILIALSFAWNFYEAGRAQQAIVQKEVMALLVSHTVIGLIGLLGMAFYSMRLEKAHETISRQAAIDALTEVPNRRSFTEQLEREFRRSKREKYPLSLAMCDVDYFKAYNDAYGNKQGDQCLKMVAQVIKQSARRPGDFCARYGGEEFAVILPNTPAKGAAHFAELMRTNVEKRKMEHVNASPQPVVTISVGVATVEADGSISYEELVSRADSALYMAKEKGRNCVEVFQTV